MSWPRLHSQALESKGSESKPKDGTFIKLNQTKENQGARVCSRLGVKKAPRGGRWV